jgi:hypothetical protein
VFYNPSGPYKPWGNAKIPHYRSNRGLRLFVSPNWLQALGGLRQTAEIRDAALLGEARLDDAGRWHKVSAAAQIADVNRGVISRAVESGELRSNGLKGSERRVCTIDLCRWILERHSEPTETDARVEALVRRHVHD